MAPLKTIFRTFFINSLSVYWVVVFFFLKGGLITKTDLATRLSAAFSTSEDDPWGPGERLRLLFMLLILLLLLLRLLRKP